MNESELRNTRRYTVHYATYRMVDSRERLIPFAYQATHAKPKSDYTIVEIALTASEFLQREVITILYDLM